MELYTSPAIFDLHTYVYVSVQVHAERAELLRRASLEALGLLRPNFKVVHVQE